MFDPWSAGAMIGFGALSNLLGSLTAKSPKLQQLNRLSPQQMSAQNNVLGQSLSMLQNPLQGFDPIAQNAQRQFENVTVPSLAERFSAGRSRISSPALLQQLSSAGADLSSNLAAQGAQYGQNQQQIAGNLLGLGLQPQFDYLSRPGGHTGLSSLLGGLGGGLTQLGFGDIQSYQQMNSLQSLLPILKQLYGGAQ